MSEFVPAELAAKVENGTHPGPSGAQHMALSSLQQHLQAHAGDSNYLSTHTVLLCDDDPVTLRTVEQLLRKFGYKVITATNARDAISHLQASKAPGGQPVDLVLTDILMPEVSGLDLMHEVIHGTLFSDVPVVVMSSQDSQESVLQAFEAGASDYLIKPLRRNEVATLWQHVWRANRFKAHKDTSSSEPAVLGNSAAPRQKGAEGTACEDPTGGSNTAETDHGSNEAGSVVPAAGPKPPALSGPHSGSATNTIAYSEQHTRLHASRFSQQVAAQSNADNASGPSSGENTVNDTGGPAAACLTRPSHPPHMLQASDNADTCTDAAVITTDDDDELREPATNRARHSSDNVPQPQGTQDQHTQHNHHHHHKGQQQVNSGGNKAVSSGQHHGTSSKLDSPAPSSSDLKQDSHHHSQQHPTRPIAERSNAQGSRALQELAVLGHLRQEQREMSVGQGSEGPAGLHHKAESQMMVVQQKASVKKETVSEPVPDTMWRDMDQQRQQEEEDAETAEAAGLLLGVAAAAAAEQQAARRAAHTSTGISGRSNRSNNGSHSNGGWGPAAGGAGGRSHGASASTAAATVAGANAAAQAGRTAFSALTVFLPRGMAPAPPAAANGTLPSSEGEGAAPNPAPVRNGNATQHHNAIRHHSSSLEPDGPVTTPASGYATTPGSSSFLSTPSAKAAGHAGHMNGMGDRPMDAEMNNHAASMFMHPGAGLMLPQSIMPLLAYSLAGMHPELQQSMYMAHGIPPSEHASGFLDSAMQQHPGMPQHVMPSVVLVAGRGESTSTAAAHRRAAVQKYLQKKKNRNFKKKVRYESRKRLAEARPRVRGQFVKQDPAAATAAAAAKSGAADLATAQSLSQEPSSSGNKQSRDDQGSGGGNASGKGRLQSRLKKRQRQGSVATDNNGHDEEECGEEYQEGLTDEEEEGANAE